MEGDIQPVAKFDASIELKRQILVAFLRDFAKAQSNQHIRTEILKIGHFFKCYHQDLGTRQDIEFKLSCNRCRQDKNIQVPSEESALQDDDKKYLSPNVGTSMTKPNLPKCLDYVNLSQSIMNFFYQEVQKIPEKYNFSFQLVADMLEKHGKIESEHGNDCLVDTKQSKEVGLQISDYK